MNAADEAAVAAALFAMDPPGFGGVCLRSLAQPARTQWLELLQELLPHDAPLRRIPCNVSDDRLLGGLDIAASLAAQRPVIEQGVLAAADGGVLVVAMAERLSMRTAACICAALDHGAVDVHRDGVAISAPARVGLVALDESLGEERMPAALVDRMAFIVDLDGFDLRTPLLPLHDRDAIEAARALLPQVRIDTSLVEGLCGASLALGAGSLRVALLAVRAARAIAALDGRHSVQTDDAAAAGRIVLAPRATRLPPPATEPSGERSDPAPSPPSPPDRGDGAGEPGEATGPPEDVVVAAARAAIPPGLLARLGEGDVPRGPVRGTGGGRSGAPRSGGHRGRPVGLRTGVPRGGARLNLLGTLRAAAPWQRLRAGARPDGPIIRIEPGDLRSTRHQQRSRTLTIFAVDASGSSALHRLAEAKGAVQALLADCYVRRDLVAVITFRGRRADVLLPPTRSLARAKRQLAGLPGGGGTPLASAIECSALLAGQALRRGESPLLVLLSDGRANVALNGVGGRDGAHADALRAARVLRGLGIPALFIDTSPHASAQAAEVAATMRAEYLPLPSADARSLSRVVNAAAASPARAGGR